MVTKTRGEKLVRVDDGLWRSAKAAAALDSLTLTEFIEAALREKLARREKEQKR